MREILFRGKHFKTGKWVTGLLWHHTDKASAIYSDDKDRLMWVDPETVGQCTGLTATNGMRIFEGDIVKAKVIQNQWSKTREYTAIFVVAYHPSNCYFYLKREGNNLLFDGNWSYGVFINEVVGNIHDNPELLQEV